ncbi:hypothetical protein SteCoe_20600 [Stentor coeruleus]|uniref:RING-type domain-containing protein n=1 Tax=Stentor coeruleus TaxID=5963 RepID=A0A1R2BRX2_9CILI|nr:hypothetical protein SteCoe_20600 [Stentor coeruleus]
MEAKILRRDLQLDSLPEYTEVSECDNPLYSYYGSIGLAFLDILVRAHSCPEYSFGLYEVIKKNIESIQDIMTQKELTQEMHIFNQLLDLMNSPSYNRSQLNTWLRWYMSENRDSSVTSMIYTIQHIIYKLCQSEDFKDEILITTSPLKQKTLEKVIKIICENFPIHIKLITSEVKIYCRLGKNTFPLITITKTMGPGCNLLYCRQISEYDKSQEENSNLLVEPFIETHTGVDIQEAPQQKLPFPNQNVGNYKIPNPVPNYEFIEDKESLIPPGPNAYGMRIMDQSKANNPQNEPLLKNKHDYDMEFTGVSVSEDNTYKETMLKPKDNFNTVQENLPISNPIPPHPFQQKSGEFNQNNIPIQPSNIPFPVTPKVNQKLPQEGSFAMQLPQNIPFPPKTDSQNIHSSGFPLKPQQEGQFITNPQLPQSIPFPQKAGPQAIPNNSNFPLKPTQNDPPISAPNNPELKPPVASQPKEPGNFNMSNPFIKLPQNTTNIPPIPPSNNPNMPPIPPSNNPLLNQSNVPPLPPSNNPLLNQPNVPGNDMSNQFKKLPQSNPTPIPSSNNPISNQPGNNMSIPFVKPPQSNPLYIPVVPSKNNLIPNQYNLPGNSDMSNPSSKLPKGNPLNVPLINPPSNPMPNMPPLPQQYSTLPNLPLIPTEKNQAQGIPGNLPQAKGVVINPGMPPFPMQRSDKNLPGSGVGNDNKPSEEKKNDALNQLPPSTIIQIPDQSKAPNYKMPPQSIPQFPIPSSQNLIPNTDSKNKIPSQPNMPFSTEIPKHLIPSHPQPGAGLDQGPKPDISPSEMPSQFPSKISEDPLSPGKKASLAFPLPQRTIPSMPMMPGNFPVIPTQNIPKSNISAFSGFPVVPKVPTPILSQSNSNIPLIQKVPTPNSNQPGQPNVSNPLIQKMPTPNSSQSGQSNPIIPLIQKTPTPNSNQPGQPNPANVKIENPLSKMPIPVSIPQFTSGQGEKFVFQPQEVPKNIINKVPEPPLQGPKVIPSFPLPLGSQINKFSGPGQIPQIPPMPPGMPGFSKPQDQIKPDLAANSSEPKQENSYFINPPFAGNQKSQPLSEKFPSPPTNNLPSKVPPTPVNPILSGSSNQESPSKPPSEIPFSLPTPNSNLPPLPPNSGNIKTEFPQPPQDPLKKNQLNANIPFPISQNLAFPSHPSDVLPSMPQVPTHIKAENPIIPTPVQQVKMPELPQSNPAPVIPQISGLPKGQEIPKVMNMPTPPISGNSSILYPSLPQSNPLPQLGNMEIPKSGFQNPILGANNSKSQINVPSPNIPAPPVPSPPVYVPSIPVPSAPILPVPAVNSSVPINNELPKIPPIPNPSVLKQFGFPGNFQGIPKPPIQGELNKPSLPEQAGRPKFDQNLVEIVKVVTQYILDEKKANQSLLERVGKILDKDPELNSIAPLKELGNMRSLRTSIIIKGKIKCGICKLGKDDDDFTIISCGDSKCQCCSKCRTNDMNPGCPMCGREYSNYEIELLKITKESLA